MKPSALPPLNESDFDRLEQILAHLAEHDDTAPDIEQLDGFLAALACGLPRVDPVSCLPVLLSQPGRPEDADPLRELSELMTRRYAEVLAAVDAPVQRLDDERALNPLLTDWDAVRKHTPEAEREQLGTLPSLGAVWASGFLQCVDAFEDDWLLEADDPGNEFIDGCLQLFEILASDVAEMPPEARAMSPDERLADALWAVYDLRDFWRERASRQPVATVRKAAEPGRNDPCPCGSGKKYKKCHGDPAAHPSA